MGRGMITPEIEAKSEELLGFKITVGELRLLPYIDYCLKNGGCIDKYRIDMDEITYLSKFEDMGFMWLNGRKTKVSKQFYDAIQELLWMAYVECE